MTACLNQSKWMMCPLALAVLVFTAIPSLAQTTQPRGTHDGGILYVPPPRSVDALNWLETAPVQANGVQAPAPDDTAWQRAIATHASLIATKSLLLRVVSDPNSDVVKTKWFAATAGSDAAADWLAKNLHVAQIPGTALIEIWIDGAIAPDDAGKIIDEVGSMYIDDHRKLQTDSLINRKNALDQLRARHETTIRQLRQDSSRAQGDLQVDNTGRSTEISRKEAELFDLLSARIKVESDGADALNAVESTQEALGKAQTPSAVQMQINQNPRIVALRQQLDALEIEIGSQPTTDTAAQLKPLTNRRKAIQDRLESVIAEVRPDVTAAYVDELQNRLGGTQRRLVEMTKTIGKLHLDISDLSFQMSRFTQMSAELNALIELNRQEREQLDRLNTFISTMNLNDIVWMEHPPKGQ